MENEVGRRSSGDDLFSRTWKTVAVLVGACVLFVGALSGAAVLVTSHVFPDGHKASTADSDEAAKADSKPDAKSSTKPDARMEKGAKKPVSI